MEKYIKNLLFFLKNYYKRVYPIPEKNSRITHGYVVGFNGKIKVKAFDFGIYFNKEYDYDEFRG